MFASSGSRIVASISDGLGGVPDGSKSGGSGGGVSLSAFN